MKRQLLAFSVVVFGVIWWQALAPLWNPHLQVDVWISWERVNYFLTHGNTFVGLTGNEILPATLMYILSPILLVPAGFASYANYLPITLLLNLGVLLITLSFVRERKTYLWILLFLGPLLLFRFDGLVVLLLILSLLMFERGRFAPSGFCLGAAIGMKVFPIIILPYLLLILWQRRQLRQGARLLIGMGEALLIPMIVFWGWGGNWEQVTRALSFHSQKLISIESITGSLITLWGVISNGVPPQLLPGNGIWSVAGPVALFNKIWMVPIGVLYLFLLRQKMFIKKLDWRVPLAIILLFLVFSKNLNPQYLWWYMALLAMVKADWRIVVLTTIVALLNQLVYPVFYTRLIDNFYQFNKDYWIFGILLLRNAGVVVTAAWSLLKLKERDE